jgi:signal transduction histidine kinase
VVLSNAALEKKLNFSADQLLSKSLSTLPWAIESQKANGQRRLPWSQTLKDGKNRIHETLSYQLSEQESLTLIANCTALRDVKESIRGALVSFYDVTEIEKMYKELDNMSKFLRHEMHNALIGAGVTITLLEQSDQLGGDDKKLLQRAKSSHRVIKYLLDSVREAKSIEASFRTEETRPLRLDKVVEEAVKNYSDIYRGNPFQFESGGAELTVFGQEERIIQMLDKLTSNAVDHSDPGTPIEFSCYRKDKHVLLTVANQGQPLPKNKKALFELFASFRNITATQHNQGIGLYIVKLIAEAYGGSVEARDRKGVTGAEFIVRLPIL